MTIRIEIDHEQDRYDTDVTEWQTETTDRLHKINRDISLCLARLDKLGVWADEFRLAIQLLQDRQAGIEG